MLISAKLYYCLRQYTRVRALSMFISPHCLALRTQLCASTPVTASFSLPCYTSALMMQAKGLSEALVVSTKLYGVTCQKTFPTALEISVRSFGLAACFTCIAADRTRQLLKSQSL